MKTTVIPAAAGYYLLRIWDFEPPLRTDDPPFVEAIPIVAWQVSEDANKDEDSLEGYIVHAMPIAPGWQNNDDIRVESVGNYPKPWATQAPDGRVLTPDGDFYRSVETWADSFLKKGEP